MISVKSLSKTFLILERIRRDIIINVRRCSCKLPVILVRFEWNFNFQKYSNMKSHENPSSGKWAPYRGTGGRATIVAFRNFANAPQNTNFTHFVKPNICFGIEGLFLLVVLVILAFAWGAFANLILFIPCTILESNTFSNKHTQ